MAKKIKDLLPLGWCKLLAEKTGKSRTFIHDIVSKEDITHECWKHVLDLARSEQERIKSNRLRTDELLGVDKSTTVKFSKKRSLVKV